MNPRVFGCGAEVEVPQDRRGHLGRVDRGGHDGGSAGFLVAPGAVHDQQGHVGVVGGKAPVLGDLRLARGVDRAGDGLDDDVGRPGIVRRVVELLGQGVARQDLLDVGGVGARAVGFQRRDGPGGLALVLQPDQRDVVLGDLGDLHPGVGQDR